MKKILISLMIIALVCLLLGVGVYLAFSDTETSASNSFAAGTLDLEVDDENPWVSVKIDVDAMSPGDSGAVTCKLENVGTIDGTSLTVDLDNLADDAGTTPEPEIAFNPDNGELSANMDILMWEDDGAGGGTAGNAVQDGTEVTLYSGKLNAEAGPYTVGSGLDASATTYVGISYSIDSGVGNVIQDDSCTFDIVFVLTQ
jgi:predicted ribosomally synthesized peptide with SipW-like signal peptide